jgi:hypothetical protein
MRPGSVRKNKKCTQNKLKERYSFRNLNCKGVITFETPYTTDNRQITVGFMTVSLAAFCMHSQRQITEITESICTIVNNNLIRQTKMCVGVKSSSECKS